MKHADLFILICKAISLLASLAASATNADAAQLKAVVIAPAEAEAGSDLWIDSTESVGDILKRHWKLEAVPPTAIRAGRKQFDLSDPVKPRLLSYPGRYTVTLTIVGVDGELDTTSVAIKITGDSDCDPQPIPPRPNPTPPDPAPTPTPPSPSPPEPVPPPSPEPVPVGEFNVSPAVAEIVKKIVDSAKAATAEKLRAELESIAAQVAAGTITDVNTLLTAIGTALKNTGNAAWQAAAGEVSNLLRGVYEKHKGGRLGVTLLGGLRDSSGWATLLRELALGVKAGASK